MKGLSKHLGIPCCILIALAALSCAAREEGWKARPEKTLEGDVRPLLATATRLTDGADTREKVRALVGVYEEVLKMEPDNRDALAGLGSCCFLLGYGYGADRADKKLWYDHAMRYCERLVYLNPAFRARADTGARLWEATDTLTAADMNALWWWFLAAGSYWTECLGPVDRLVNMRMVLGTKSVLARMMAIDPKWQNGCPYYMWANYYAQAPSVLGGDLKKSGELFGRAIETGPGMLNFRRTRARNLYTKTGDRAGFVADMEWVVKQDPHRATLGYHWNAFIQRDARQGLADVDRLFGR